MHANTPPRRTPTPTPTTGTKRNTAVPMQERTMARVVLLSSLAFHQFTPAQATTTLKGCECLPEYDLKGTTYVTCTEKHSKQHTTSGHAHALWCKTTGSCGTQHEEGYWFDECPTILFEPPAPPPSDIRCCRGYECNLCTKKPNDLYDHCGACADNENKCARSFHQKANGHVMLCAWVPSAFEGNGTCVETSHLSACTEPLTPPLPARPPRPPHPPHPPHSPGWHRGPATSPSPADVLPHGLSTGSLFLAVVVGFAAAATSWYVLRCVKRGSSPTNPRLRLRDGPDTALPSGAEIPPPKDEVQVEEIELANAKSMD